MTGIINLIRLTHPTATNEVLEAESALYEAQDFLLSQLRNDDTFNEYSDEVLWNCIKEITNN